LADSRRIVVDTSALVPAFFPERSRAVNRGALRLLAAIRTRAAVAFAPEVLQAEFLKRAVRRLIELTDVGRERDTAVLEVEAQWLEFLRAPIVYTPALVLAATAWDATSRHSMPAPDSWFLACALHHDAELWLSHPPADSAGEWARRYGASIRYLSEGSSEK
jgi:predicted nucleic acid-binding protein